MPEHKNYVPVLKGKRAEFPALAAVHDKTDITPLFEAVPTSPPQEVPRRMSGPGVWSGDAKYYIDLLFLDDPDDETSPAPHDHPLIQCFAEVAAKGQHAVPVAAFARSLTYLDATKQVVEQQEKGVALRLSPDDFEDDSELVDALNAWRDFIELDAGQIDIIIDAGSVAGSSTATVAQNHRSWIEMLPDLDDWRTLTAVSGAFPLGLADLDRDDWNVESRHDWRGWRQLVTGTRPPERLPAFGDYTIAHPNLPPTGRATILAQLRYTALNNWIIWKGGNVHKHPDGFGQFLSICADVINRPEFRGASFSWGDREIYSKATAGGSCGNPEKWRQIATNHHIETVLEQIANLP